MTTALLAGQGCSAGTETHCTQPAKTRALTSKTHSRPSQSVSATFAFFAPILPMSRVQQSHGQRSLRVQRRCTSNDPVRPNNTTLTIRLTRNPTCPNRWGSHKRCRFIGGWKSHKIFLCIYFSKFSINLFTLFFLSSHVKTLSNSSSFIFLFSQ